MLRKIQKRSESEFFNFSESWLLKKTIHLLKNSSFIFCLRMDSFRKILLKFAEYESNLDHFVIFNFFLNFTRSILNAILSKKQKFCCKVSKKKIKHDIKKTCWKPFEINKGIKNKKLYSFIWNFDIKIRNASKWSSGYQRLGRFWAVSLSVVVHASSRAQRKDHLDPRWSPHAH